MHLEFRIPREDKEAELLANALAQWAYGHGHFLVVTDQYRGGEANAVGVINGITHLSWNTSFTHPQFIHIGHACFPGWFFADRLGCGCRSALNGVSDVTGIVTGKEAVYTVERLKTHYRQNRKEYGVPCTDFRVPMHPFVLVDCLVCENNRSNLLFHWSPVSFLHSAIQYVCENIALDVVIKLHPKDDSGQVVQEVRQLARVYKGCHTTTACLSDILDCSGCIGILTMNVEVGFAGLVWGLPVITGARGGYGGVMEEVREGEMERVGEVLGGGRGLAQKKAREAYVAFCANHYFLDYNRPNTFKHLLYV